jgi:Ulp1 family protease
VFDSLGSRGKHAAIDRIRRFVISEAINRLRVSSTPAEQIHAENIIQRLQKSAPRKFMPAVYARAPLQTNSTDCGCFLLEYARRILADPPGTIGLAAARGSLMDWFPSADASEICRSRLVQTIHRLEAEWSALYGVPPSGGDPSCKVLDPSDSHQIGSSDIEEVTEEEHRAMLTRTRD